MWPTTDLSPLIRQEGYGLVSAGAIGVMSVAARAVTVPRTTVFWPCGSKMISSTDSASTAWPLRIKPPKAWRRIPILRWIWRPNGYFALPILGNAGSWREWLLLIPVSLYVVLVLAGATADLGQAGMSTFVASR